jgi:hypothetical protein
MIAVPALCLLESTLGTWNSTSPDGCDTGTPCRKKGRRRRTSCSRASSGSTQPCEIGRLVRAQTRPGVTCDCTCWREQGFHSAYFSLSHLVPGVPARPLTRGSCLFSHVLSLSLARSLCLSLSHSTCALASRRRHRWWRNSTKAYLLHTVSGGGRLQRGVGLFCCRQCC